MTPTSDHIACVARTSAPPWSWRPTWRFSAGESRQLGYLRSEAGGLFLVAGLIPALVFLAMLKADAGLLVMQ